MISISNNLCSNLHNGTIADGAVTEEKICALSFGNSGSCGGTIENFLHL